MADNCDPRKIDSNATGLSVAETICGVLPTIDDDGYLPTWFELEPNSYSDFGGDITTMARRPLSASRQRKKGTPVDLDASGGFNMDFTQDNHSRLLQGFMFADFRQKAQTAPLNTEAVEILAAVAADDTYTAAAGLTRFRVGQLVFVEGFDDSANNGLTRVLTVADGAVGVDKALNDEAAPAAVTIRAVGFQLATGGANISMVGGLPRLNLTAAVPVAASGTVTVTSAANVADGDTVTVNGVVYTYGADLGEIPVGADDDGSASNLSAAINGNVVGIEAHDDVTATVLANVVTVTAKVKGVGGNLITLAKVGTNLTVSGAVLSGGTGFSLLEAELIPGEWVYLGDDDLTNRFTNNAGFARVKTVLDQSILFDKTTWAPIAEVHGGKSVRLFIGDTIKNEKDPEDIVTRYYEFERTLGKDVDGTQAEYLTRSVMNELTLNIPTADKLNTDITFVSGDAETRTGAEGRKPGPFVPALGQDAINTSSNIVRTRMSILDPATSRPTALFAYITEATLTINNNVSGAKAVSVFGNFDVNVGDYDVGGELTAIFSTVLATRAVRENADVTFDIIAASDNKGFVFDIPLLTLGGGRIEVEPGEPITVPLEQFGAENPNGYTLLHTSFGYLPTRSHPVPGTAY